MWDIHSKGMLPEILYLELTKISISVTSLLILLLLTFKPSRKFKHYGYRITLRNVIIALIAVTIVNILELFDEYGIANFRFIIFMTLSVSTLQIFLFASTIFSMLDVQYYTKKRIWLEITPSLLFIAVGAFIYHFSTHQNLLIFFYFFSLFFVVQIIRYTIQFKKTEKETINKLDNFFSEEISKSLSWTRAAFAGLLTCCLLSLVSLVQNSIFSLLFTVYYTGYYVYFVLHYLNYINLFQDMEPALKTANESTLNQKNIYRSFDQMEEAIQKWEEQKFYLEPGITIEQVSTQLNTNRTYLSNHMNVYCKKTFKEWINELRIEEAKRLLKNCPNLPVSQIGVQVGIPDKSNFGRQFSRVTNMSPQKWRKI